MFTVDQLYGGHLSAHTLSLTFDDGPGPKTYALAEYLNKQNIPATFFMVGKHLEEYPEAPERLRALGHLAGNHTYNHFDLTDNRLSGNELVNEVEHTTTLLHTRPEDKTVFFRAPYGYWNEQVATCLNSKLDKVRRYRGPYYWDVDARDYLFWQHGQQSAACANAYLNDIQKVGRGIVLMHDSCADNEVIKKNNLTFEAIKIMVPRLKELGYRFVRLDTITNNTYEPVKA
ncbi:hypothetical protein A3860_05080 [Niastella vici]|uniref:NodB homology domain-containing protein n=1 Tax=Niastella vici TaxID=1703345 RepID=A0A1V9FRW3_9BACT|nr:polysaccharide deacetylase family protein [Niastella vici]OQP61094.1 hypothetical protein A3860_05080 [Niastella vici]